PAIFGVRVLSGKLTPNVDIVNREGERLGKITQIQESGQPISQAFEGMEVAVSMPKPIFGRHIKEKDILFVDIPEDQARKLKMRFAMRLTVNDMQALDELIEIKRKKDAMWAV
ncbi:translation initiation factor IF-2, partial [Candidatus Bathyarchaeota archaeon]|nr:translation initiation factor IF-2 [Candidatus Bathyarchaeota archaeon]